MYIVTVKTIRGYIVHQYKTTRDCSKFSVYNSINTRLNLKYGPYINVEYLKTGSK